MGSIDDRGLPPCLLCKGNLYDRFAVPRVWHQPAGSPSFRIVWCDACDYGSLWPRPTPEQLDRYYGEDYFAKYGIGHAPQAASRPGSLLDRFHGVKERLAWRLDRSLPVWPEPVHRILGNPTASVCDLGCGNGFLIKGLRDLGHPVVGVEPSPEACARAADDGVTVYQGSAESLPPQLDGARFDAVTMTHVLEHCLDPIASLRNAAGLLADGGLLFVEVPNNGSRAARSSGASWFHADVGRHVNFFTRRSLDLMVERVGLRPRQRLASCYWLQFSRHRLEAEQFVWDRLYEGVDPEARRESVRNSHWRQWGALFRTLTVRPEEKFEAVILVAAKDG